jgi:radical SAM protein with 4Fe4S-binding SPASM domain
MSIRKRLDGIVRIPDLYRVPDPPCPKSVKIELTPRCNYHCQYCGYSFRKDTRKDMDIDLFKRISKEMREEGVEEFGLFYIGEPFMNTPMLVECIEYLKKELKAPYVFITSNASLASPENVAKVMKAGLDSLKWSVNACNPYHAERMLGITKQVYEKSLRNIRDAYYVKTDNNYDTNLYASSIKYSEEYAEEAKPFLEERILPYISEHYYLSLFTMAGVATKREAELGLQPVAGNPGRCDSPVPPIPCWTLFTAAHVLSDGRLTACCMDATGKWVVGDLKTQSFKECWNSPEFQSLRAEHLKLNVLGTKCQECVMVA